MIYTHNGIFTARKNYIDLNVLVLEDIYRRWYRGKKRLELSPYSLYNLSTCAWLKKYPEGDITKWYNSECYCKYF